jgi:hypothetical protein
LSAYRQGIFAEWCTGVLEASSISKHVNESHNEGEIMDYQSNADKAKEEPVVPDKKIEKIVTGEVILKQKSIGRRLKDVFFGGDLKQSAKYVTSDVILPRLRDLIVDTASKGVARVVYGESDFRRRPVDYRPKVQYNNPLWRPEQYRDPREVRGRAFLPDQHPYRQQKRDASNVILKSRAEAERVVETLINAVEKYESASFADLCEMIGWPSTPIDNSWGWTYLTNVQIRQVREGYLIDLPQMEAL